MARELSKKEFNTIFWRSFTLLGSFNYERMEGLGFLYAILPSLKRIYKDDPEGLETDVESGSYEWTWTPEVDYLHPLSHPS